MKAGLNFVAAIVAVVMVALGATIFTVDQRQYAIIFQLGEVREVLSEPGLYFKSTDLLVPEELRGIGVRIEDDVLITQDGCEVLSARLPRSADDVEAWVEEMDGRGVRLFGEVLRPPEDATGVMVRDGRVVVSDGPFTESKEWIAGIDFLEVRDLDEAIEVAAGHPMARAGLMVLTPAWPFDVEDDHVERARREASELGKRSEPALGVAR